MLHRSFAPVAAAVLLVVGCSSTHGLGGASDPCVGLDPDSLACAMAWTASLDRDGCRSLRACDGVSISEELCDAYYPEEGGPATTDTERNRVAFEEGRIRFDPEGVRCLLEHRARCDRNPYDEARACPPLWIATSARAEGDGCGSRYECGDGMGCTDTGQRCGVGAGTCVRLASEGEACASAGETGRYCDGERLLACVDRRCARVTGIARGALGEVCNVVTAEPDGRVLSRDCAVGLGCDVGGLGEGHCVSALPCGGAACGAFTQCVEGACVPIPTPQVGDVCGGGQGLCAWASYALMCDEETRLCVETDRLLGQHCAPSWAPCIEGVCRFEMGLDGGGTHRCGAPGSLGDRCDRDVECESHACCDGACG